LHSLKSWSSPNFPDLTFLPVFPVVYFAKPCDAIARHAAAVYLSGMTRNCAPLALFVYARPDHARRTIEALGRNALASQSDLIVFSDAAKRPEIAPAVTAVRHYIRTIKGFKSLAIIERTSNLGLAASIIDGVNRVTEEFGRVIVLEDDLHTSQHFLAYMNDALELYADMPQVAAVSGYHPPFDVDTPETFFQRDAECWGWGTWRRAWAHFNPNGAALLAELKARGLGRQFDQDGSVAYMQMLEDQIAGRNDSWAIRWRASVFIKNMLSLYPSRSLTSNFGYDGSGTHCEVSEGWEEEVSGTPIVVGKIPLVHFDAAYQAFARFNRGQMPGLGKRVSRKLKKLFKAR
jgi:hypothetical protein